MDEIFLSAGVPVIGRGNYHESADPFLIQCAVREFLMAALGRRLIIWGGQPAITPMVWAVCEDLGVEYANAVVLYQSRYFEEAYPDENKHFGNVEYIDAVQGDREASLLNMRTAMLSRPDLSAAVFVGGMEGISAEYDLFTQLHPTSQVLAVPAPGGAALQLLKNLGETSETTLQDVDFAKLFHESLKIAPDEPRNVHS
jgi:hypothetical protein